MTLYEKPPMRLFGHVNFPGVLVQAPNQEMAVAATRAMLRDLDLESAPKKPMSAEERAESLRSGWSYCDTWKDAVAGQIRAAESAAWERAIAAVNEVIDDWSLSGAETLRRLRALKGKCHEAAP